MQRRHAGTHEPARPGQAPRLSWRSSAGLPARVLCKSSTVACMVACPGCERSWATEPGGSRSCTETAQAGACSTRASSLLREIESLVDMSRCRCGRVESRWCSADGWRVGDGTVSCGYAHRKHTQSQTKDHAHTSAKNLAALLVDDAQTAPQASTPCHPSPSPSPSPKQ